MIGFYDPVDLYVIKIKKPMVLCKRNTSRSSEQNMKRQSRSENMRKVCLFCSEDNKVLWLSNMADTFLEKFTKAQRTVSFFSWLCFRDVDWLGIQSPITWQPSSEQILSSNVTLETSAIIRFSCLVHPYQVQLIKPSVLHEHTLVSSQEPVFGTNTI